MIVLSIAFVPLRESFAIGRFGLVKPFCSHGSAHNFARWGAMCGHNPFAVSLVFALVAFLMVLPAPGIAYLRGHGEFVRGLVEVVFFTPFHGGMITRKRKEIKA